MLSVTARFIQRLLLFLPFLFFYGCAPTIIQIDREMLLRLKNEPQILAVHYEPPTFEVSGPEAVSPLLGLLAALGTELETARSEVKRVGKDYNPSLRVKEGFISAIEARLGFKNIRSLKETLSTEDLSELKEKFGNIIVIDFLTRQWSLFSPIFSPTSGEGRLLYEVHSRLVRLEDSKVLWQGMCQFIKVVPSLEELKANNGVLLKENLDEAAGYCVSQLAAQLSG